MVFVGGHSNCQALFTMNCDLDTVPFALANPTVMPGNVYAALVIRFGGLSLRCPVDSPLKKKKKNWPLFVGLVDFEGNPFPRKVERRAPQGNWVLPRQHPIGLETLAPYSRLKRMTAGVALLLDGGLEVTYFSANEHRIEPATPPLEGST